MATRTEENGKVSTDDILRAFGKGRRWRVVTGNHEGETGVCVGRFCDPSYNDYQLEFEDGSVCWYSRNKIEPAQEATP